MSDYPEAIHKVNKCKDRADKIKGLVEAAKVAKNFIKMHHWRFNPPIDKFPEGSWDLAKAQEAYEVLEQALAALGEE